MRVLWYAGTSAALAAGVVIYACNQRANFYSAMVYLSQNNLSLMILINLILLVYGTFVYGLQRLCYGQLRPVEVEQLYEKAWFAVTETCLAMTIFREEVGAWFLVMFTALVTGKVWEWIGEGRVEVLEQQPPANPRLFHTRLSISLLFSVAYDLWLWWYTVNAVIVQARPNMMVMFLFEFAILTTCSLRTSLRYLLSLVEANVIKQQTNERMAVRRKEVQDLRADILRRRESGDAAEAEAANREQLPREEDIDEMDIDVPGWESKGQWILTLDLVTDFCKLAVYGAFFAVLMMFYGLPIHIMRDLFMTTRSFLKRLSALVRYRRALQDMNKYPDAVQEELRREDTCIICREEMRPWDPSDAGAVERSRPKKLPCGHILHFGCLKSWLERQQVCPTCRRPVSVEAAPQAEVAARLNGAGAQAANAAAPGNGGGAGQGNAGVAGRLNGMRMIQLGPIRFGFAQGNPQHVEEMMVGLGLDVNAAHGQEAAGAGPEQAESRTRSRPDNVADMNAQLQDLSSRLQHEVQNMQNAAAELHTLRLLTAEMQRLRQVQEQSQNAPVQTQAQAQPAQAQQAQAHQAQAQVHQAQVHAHLAQVHAQAHAQAHDQAQAQAGPNFAVPAAQAAFGFQPQPFLPPFAGIPPMPQYGVTPHPMFASFPPWANAPLMTRHAPGPQSTTIPAGSPDLPPGLVLPPGWSLMPLERVEGPSPPLGPVLGPGVALNGRGLDGGGVQLRDGTATATDINPAAVASSGRTEQEPTPAAPPNQEGPKQGSSVPVSGGNDSSGWTDASDSTDTTVAAGASGTGKHRGSGRKDKGKGKAVAIEDADED